MALHKCYWCGSVAKAAHGLSLHPQGEHSVFIRCVARDCYVTTHFHNGETIDEAFAKAAHQWETGAIALPLTATLPHNAYILQREPLGQSNELQQASRMWVRVPNHRDISRKMLRDLAICFDAMERPLPHRFTLHEGYATHTGVEIKEMERKGGRIEFLFQCLHTIYPADNRGDGAWLNQPATRPPILDRVFDLLAGSSDAGGDE